MMQQIHRGFIVIAGLALGVLIVACGGGGGGSVAGGGIGGTGITSGSVTGFGSVFVNGIEFETDGASRSVDDETDISDGTDDDTVLGIGMVVTITGTVNADGVTGTAESIEYDNEVEGPVAAAPVEDLDGVTKTFDIFNITVVADRNATVYEATGYDSLAQNDLLEVSGYFDADGNLLATRIEKQGVLVLGVSEVEIRGTVSGFDDIDTFMLGGVTVTFDGTTEFEDLPGTVANGQYVEVEGTLETASSIAASRIELEEEGFGDDVDEISLEGIVTDFNGISDFRVAGQRVNASNATFEPGSLKTSIADGDQVEVEGSIVNGILRAEEVEQRGGDVRVSAIVVSKNSTAGTVTLQVVSGQPSLSVMTNTQTQIEDKRDEEEPFGIGNIDVGDYLNIEGYVDGNGNIIAAQIEREEPDSTELRGPVDVPPTFGNNLAGTVSIFGIEILTDGSTEFEDASEVSINGVDFFNNVSDGDLIAFEDELPANGVADEVEFED
ncbi:MAG: DUF5666 domain-containing protein [Gammaproteobacteria bacterium]|jgi:hypothetical protein